MTISIHACNIANDLKRAASVFVANPDLGVRMSVDAATHHADTLRGAAALIRELASNQLPDFDSIQPATPQPHAAEIVEAWSQRCSAQYTGAAAAARLSLAAAWIKARDQEIAQLRTALSRVQPPPEAFEPPTVFQGVKLGDYIDARKLGGAVKCDGDPIPSPSLPDLPELYAMCQRVFAKLETSHDERREAEREHWRAMEHQTRRIADANAFRAMTAGRLRTPSSDALLSRMQADALK